jgi:hypothetical protein
MRRLRREEEGRRLFRLRAIERKETSHHSTKPAPGVGAPEAFTYESVISPEDGTHEQR